MCQAPRYMHPGMGWVWAASPGGGPDCPLSAGPHGLRRLPCEYLGGGGGGGAWGLPTLGVGGVHEAEELEQEPPSGQGSQAGVWGWAVGHWPRAGVFRAALCISPQGPAGPKGDLGAKGQQGIPGPKVRSPKGLSGVTGCLLTGRWPGDGGLCLVDSLWLFPWTSGGPARGSLSLGVELVPRGVSRGM